MKQNKPIRHELIQALSKTWCNLDWLQALLDATSLCPQRCIDCGSMCIKRDRLLASDHASHRCVCRPVSKALAASEHGETKSTQPNRGLLTPNIPDGSHLYAKAQLSIPDTPFRTEVSVRLSSTTDCQWACSGVGGEMSKQHGAIPLKPTFWPFSFQVRVIGFTKATRMQFTVDSPDQTHQRHQDSICHSNRLGEKYIWLACARGPSMWRQL